MEVITMEADAFYEIMARFDKLEQFIIEKKRMNPLPDVWLDINEVCQLLKISKRTLQAYRDNGIISYSQISGKIYFKAGDIDKHLKDNYSKSYKK
jgi:hypothetical protein